MSNLNIKKNSPLLILMLNLFIALLGQGMVIPILPEYLKQFNAAGTAAGYLVAAFGVAQFLFSPIGGRFADKYGRKIVILSGLFLTVIADFKLIVISLLMASIMLLLMLVKVNFAYLLVVSSAFFAFNSFLRPSVNVLLSNESESNEQGFVSGLNNTYMSIGNIVGPIFAGNLFDKNINLPYIIAAVILICTIFLTKKRDPLYKECGC